MFITNSCFCKALSKGICYFSVIVTFDCNLQCKNCINCSPLVGQKNLNFPEIDYENTLSKYNLIFFYYFVNKKRD